VSGYTIPLTLQSAWRGKHDDRKGHHYYTSASQAEVVVYSSDDPCGHHGVGAVIMLRKNRTRTNLTLDDMASDPADIGSSFP